MRSHVPARCRARGGSPQAQGNSHRSASLLNLLSTPVQLCWISCPSLGSPPPATPEQPLLGNRAMSMGSQWVGTPADWGGPDTQGSSSTTCCLVLMRLNQLENQFLPSGVVHWVREDSRCTGKKRSHTRMQDEPSSHPMFIFLLWHNTFTPPPLPLFMPSHGWMGSFE